MLRCLTIRCVVARHVDDGDARYSSVCQLFTRCVGTHCAWTDPFNSGSFLSRTALQRSVRSQQAEKYRSTSTHPPLPSWRTEIHAPGLIGSCSLEPLSPRRCSLALARRLHPLQRQAFFRVQPIHQVLAHIPAFAVQQYADLTVSVAYSCLSNLADSHPQLSPWIEAASIPVGRSWQAQNTTSMSFAYLKAPYKTLHHRSTPRRLYHFFESTSCNIALSSVSSATSFFKRRFSS